MKNETMERAYTVKIIDNKTGKVVEEAEGDAVYYSVGDSKGTARGNSFAGASLRAGLTALLLLDDVKARLMSGNKRIATLYKMMQSAR